MNELVIISGKGGTGKTSVTASFAALAERAVFADGDVDAADLHLVLRPEIRREEPFTGGKVARVDSPRCTACGKCGELCRFGAVAFDGPGNESAGKTFRVDPVACEGCGVCVRFCPEGAIAFEPAVNGRWFVSETRFGPLVHARLTPGAGNSGKLVTRVRGTAREIAERAGFDLMITDGPPGIGCPVIASLTGASRILAVAEPTLSGRHDLERVLALARHFEVPASVVVNKWDINPEMTRSIEELAGENGADLAGRIRFDRAVTRAMVRGMSVVEDAASAAADDMTAVWHTVRGSLPGGGE